MSTTIPDSTQTTPHLQPAALERRPGQLCVRIADSKPQTVLVEHATIKIGRSHDANLTIRDGSISKVHCSLRLCDDGVEVEDLGSKNGVWYADRRVQRILLRPGDAFYVGKCRIEILEVADVDVPVTTQDVCGELFGSSVAMREVFAYLGRVAPAPLDVLILGESGTGKELTARTIHNLSNRGDGPFVVLDCSSLPSTLADAALFGVRRGAFTGAVEEHAGLIERANGGTLFVDELGELPYELQAKFLRALDQREISRLGEYGELRAIDVRVVAATNRNLKADISSGRFREDLYHRIAQTVVSLPSLRDRGLDIIRLAERLLAKIADEHGIHATLGEDAKAAMFAYAWPGNVRELKNVIKQSVFTAPNTLLTAEDLRLGEDIEWARRIAAVVAEDRRYEEMHMLVDQNYLKRVMEEAGSLSKAAKMLGITRDRLRARLRMLGLYVE